MITLKIKERLYLTGVLNSYKGSLSGLAYILEDIRKVNLTGEEKLYIGLREEPVGSGVIKWDIENDIEIELSQVTKEFVKEYIQKKDEEQTIEVGDEPLIHILKKIEEEKGI